MAEPEQREEALFGAALKLPACDRAAHLDDACAGNAELRRRVEVLLGAFERAGGFMKEPARPAAEPTRQLPQRPTEKPGDRIGRYKLLEQIGEGGCGVVHMAEQQEPVRRRVALKVIKLGMDTRQVIARFEAERQALALMDHPNIARVLDAGSTDSGRPFFVMELVRGVKITEFCDHKKLSTEERLNLFIQVCQAVQHAHQKGIIHRDLKPSNILVTIVDGAPVPKVIDFGIAKATSNQPLTDKTLFTAFEQFIGTPAYMSPEQAEMSGIDVDTRTDLYSLGVVLYELLTGKTPFDAEELLRSGIDQIRRTIREQEPPKPSTRLHALPSPDLTTAAQARQTDAKKLLHSVSGDLDWIVMKCLEKERARRYETANGLARDIERHLKCEPVVARPPSRLYEFQKTVKRHKLGFAAAAAVMMALATGLGVSTWTLIKERQARQRAVAAEREQGRLRAVAQTAQATEARLRLEAETEAARSAQVAAFMKGMLNGIRPSVALGRDTTMLREILDATTKRLDDLKGQPAVEADLRSVVGTVYLDLGEYQTSEAMFRAVLALRREIWGNKHADVAYSLSNVGEALRKQGRYDEAEPFFTEALAMQRELLGSNAPAVGQTLFRLGMMHNVKWQRAEAEPFFREALEILRQDPNEDLRAPLDQLALSLMRPGKFAEAESTARECLALCRKQAPSGDLQLGWTLYHFGYLFRMQGRHAEAVPYLREGLEIQRKHGPRDHNDTLWNINALASCLIACNRADEAGPLVDEFVRLAEGKALMSELIRRLLADWTRLLRQTSRFRETVPYFEKVTKLDPTNHWNWYEAAGLYLYVGDVERYRGACREMLDRFERDAADNPAIACMVAKTCALAPDSVTDFSRVERMAERCISGTEKHEYRRWFIHAKALNDYRAGHHEQAVVWLKRFAPKMSGTHWDGSGFAILAMAHQRLGHADDARRSLGTAREILAKKPPDAMRNWSWRDWLHSEILCREAEALIEPNEKSKSDSVR